jgi:hypothetical protein
MKDLHVLTLSAKIQLWSSLHSTIYIRAEHHEGLAYNHSLIYNEFLSQIFVLVSLESPASTVQNTHN